MIILTSDHRLAPIALAEEIGLLPSKATYTEALEIFVINGCVDAMSNRSSTISTAFEDSIDFSFISFYICFSSYSDFFFFLLLFFLLICCFSSLFAFFFLSFIFLFFLFFSFLSAYFFSSHYAFSFYLPYLFSLRKLVRSTMLA